MFRAIILTVFVVILLLSSYLYFASYQNVEVKIEKLKEEYQPKELLEIKLNIKNTGKKPNYFFVNLKSNLGTSIPQTVLLKPNHSQDLTCSLNISSKAPEGVHPVNITVKARRILPSFEKESKPITLFNQDIFVNVKLPPPPPPKPVVIKPKPLTGITRFVNLPERFIYNTTSYIKAKMENTSDRTAKFILWLNISGPQKTNTVFSHIEELEPLQSKEITFEHFVDGKFHPEGDYFLSSELRNLDTDALLAADSAVSSLVDTPPEIILTSLSLPTKKEQKKKPVEFVYELKDDIGIKQSQLVLTDLKTNFTTYYTMTPLTDNKRSGKWLASFILPKKIKEFSYYAIVTDSKGQQKLTEKRRISSIEEK